MKEQPSAQSEMGEQSQELPLCYYGRIIDAECINSVDPEYQHLYRETIEQAKADARIRKNFIRGIVRDRHASLDERIGSTILPSQIEQ